jgi:CRP/FNR family cyclic AMP-dependent transcriptional regulator
LLDYVHDKDAFVKELSLIGKNKGDFVVKEGDSGDFMFVIIEGKVKVVLKRGKKEIVLATLEKGNFFGEMSLFGVGPRSASVKAITDLKLLKITRKDIEKLGKTNPKLLSEFTMGLCTELCQRVSNTSTSLESYYHINRAILKNPKFRNFLQKIWNEKEE